MRKIFPREDVSYLYRRFVIPHLVKARKYLKGQKSSSVRITAEELFPHLKVKRIRSSKFFTIRDAQKILDCVLKPLAKIKVNYCYQDLKKIAFFFEHYLIKIRTKKSPLKLNVFNFKNGHYCRH